MATIASCVTSSSEELALALEIHRTEGVGILEALERAASLIRDVLSYAADWDARSQAAQPQRPGAA